MEEASARDAERLHIADATVEKSDNTGWWNFTKWPEHFGGRNLKLIAHASRLPDRDEKGLLAAIKIVSTMIKNTVDGLSTLHDDTPHWLRTANSTNRVENRPMVRLQNIESLDCYIGYWKRFVCYCLRVHKAQRTRAEREDLRGTQEAAEDESGDEVGSEAVKDCQEETTKASEEGDDLGDDKENAHARRMKDCCELVLFTAEQEQRLQEMQESLEAEEDGEAQLLKMMALVMSFIKQSIKGFDRFHSPMVHFAAVLGIDGDNNRLYRGDEYSFKLAGFIYCIRVMFVEHALPAATRAEQTTHDIDNFLEMRKKYLVVRGYNPTGELIKWMGYGKTMSMQKTNQPSITWSRSSESRPDKDVLYFHGKPLPII